MGRIPMDELRDRTKEAGQPWRWHSRGKQTSWCNTTTVWYRPVVPEQTGMAVDGYGIQSKVQTSWLRSPQI